MNNIEDFAQRLKELREKKGLTQAQLAEMVGVTPQTISAYEKYKNGEKGKTPALDKAIAIANALGTSLDYLCSINEQANNPLELRDYVAVVQYINELTKYFPCSAGTAKVPLPPEEWYPVGQEPNGDTIYEYEELVAVIKIRSAYLADFIQKRNKMRKLLDERTIDGDLYESWYSGELERLRKAPMKTISYPNDIYPRDFLDAEEGADNG